MEHSRLPRGQALEYGSGREAKRDQTGAGHFLGQDLVERGPAPATARAGTAGPGQLARAARTCTDMLSELTVAELLAVADDHAGCPQLGSGHIIASRY